MDLYFTFVVDWDPVWWDLWV